MASRPPSLAPSPNVPPSRPPRTWSGLIVTVAVSVVLLAAAVYPTVVVPILVGASTTSLLARKRS